MILCSFHSSLSSARKRSVVIAGLDPAIHPSLKKLLAKKMDARVKPAHDDVALVPACAGTTAYMT
jgi:hypothetical protein